MAAQSLTRHLVVGSVSLAGATSGTICSFDLSSAAASPTGVAWDGCSVTVFAKIVGYNTAGTAGATIAQNLSALFKRVAGTLSRIGTVDLSMALKSDAALALVAFDLDASGNLIRVRATNVVGETTLFIAEMQLFMNQPA